LATTLLVLFDPEGGSPPIAFSFFGVVIHGPEVDDCGEKAVILARKHSLGDAVGQQT
jgi:hypothetical protein